MSETRRGRYLPGVPCRPNTRNFGNGTLEWFRLAKVPGIARGSTALAADVRWLSHELLVLLEMILDLLPQVAERIIRREAVACLVLSHDRSPAACVLD